MGQLYSLYRPPILGHPKIKISLTFVSYKKYVQNYGIIFEFENIVCVFLFLVVGKKMDEFWGNIFEIDEG